MFLCVTGLDPLGGLGGTGQKQGPSAFMMTSCWGGEADWGGGVSIIQQEEMAEWPLRVSLSRGMTSVLGLPPSPS